jgi:hypothetical protein
MARIVALFLLVTGGASALSMEPLADPSAARQAGYAGPKKYYGGAGVGRLTLDEDEQERWACQYDMVLVERIQGKPPTESGLFVPQEDLPRLHLCKGMCAMLYQYMLYSVSIL